MKIVINKCYGGFSLSEAVYKELGIEWDTYGYLSNEDLGIKSDHYNAYRSNEKLIKAIEKLGVEKSSGNLSELKIVEIPNNVDFYIDDYDGIESIHEQHRSW